MAANMKYAHVERERRYLYLGDTAEMSPVRKFLVNDHYMRDSTLRLRRVDEELTGLSLAEVDLGEDIATHDPLPFEKTMEVTLDERFTGGKLADTSSQDLLLILREHGAR